jgi:hypothetical protein
LVFIIGNTNNVARNESSPSSLTLLNKTWALERV